MIINIKIPGTGSSEFKASEEFISFFAVLLLTFLFFSCKQSQTNQWQANSNAELQVYFFYITDRCAACTAIENNTKKVLDENFKTQMENGIINFTSFNIDKKENRALVEKYQISYTSLLLVRADGTKTDFTNTSFNYAYTDPSKFKELLKAEIEKNLK